jgi:multidrug efflux pump subunit AcrB
VSRVIDWFTRNGVAANLLLAVIVVGGLLALANLTREVFPEITPNLVSVSVRYPGAAPAEIESAIVVRIEERVQDLQGIERLTSTAVEGVGSVLVEVERGFDPRRLLEDVKARVDAIDTFPEDAERPVVQEVTRRRQVLNVAVHGPADERTLKQLAQRMQDELLALPGITQVELAAVRPDEISIELSEDALLGHGLTFDQVAGAIRRFSLDLPGGAVRTDAGEVILRATGQAYTGRDFEAIPLTTRPDGTRVLVGDVARIVDGFAETDQTARFDGHPAALVQVFRVGAQSAPTVARAVAAYVEEAQARMPEGVRLTIWQDDSRLFQSRVDLLLRNGLAGAVLVLLVLALFLRPSVAWRVALGIPVSFLGALWLMPTFGVSINMLSLFAFLLVLGILIDNGIVVGESIYTRLQAGHGGPGAASAGARYVAMPVIFAVLTTVAAFAPLLTVTGPMGEVIQAIPIIVISALMFSLALALLVLPSHLSHISPDRPEAAARGRGPRAAWRRVQGGIAGGLEHGVAWIYRPALAWALEWRYLTAAGSVAILVLFLGLVLGGFVRFTFFPPVEADNAVALLTMPRGTSAEVTARAVRQIEASALVLRDELAREGHPDVIRHVLASVGEQPFRTAHQRGAATPAAVAGAHLGEVNIELVPSEQRELSSSAIAARWRALTGSIPDAVELSFTASLLDTGEAINVQLTGPDLVRLRAAADALKARLADYPGVFDIADTFRAGKQELTLHTTPEAEALGVGLADLGRQVRQAFFGEEVQRVVRGREDVKVMARYPEERRRSLGDLETMRIRLAGGLEVAFGTVARAEFTRGFAVIQRTDRRRAVNVTADVDPAVATPNQVNADIGDRVLPALLAEFPDVRYTFEGEQRQQREIFAGLEQGFALALFLIFALLAIPFRSYLQPLLVMTSIPFGVVGAILGHLLLGMDLTVLSLFGIVALAGVVVNNGLILVDFINRFRAEGGDIHEAITRAGAARARPVLLTTLTTFVGLTPLLLERSVQAQFLIPMATSLAFGVLVSSVITLLVLPVSYRILEDVLRAVRAGRPLAPPGPEALREATD